MKNFSKFTLIAGGVAIVLALVAFGSPSQSPARTDLAMPEFGNQNAAAWINTVPLSRRDFQGHVVLIEIWTSS